jgi:predicted GNAT superfamily acetyltransferase
VRRILAGHRASPAFPKKAVRIAIPAAIEDLRMTDSVEAAHLQNAVRAQFTRWFAEGYAATAVERSPLGVDYILEPWKKV